MNDTTHREQLHRRSLDLGFYKRSDGLYEVEGRLIDTKTHNFRTPLATDDTLPGSPIHDITVRLIVDEDLLVQDAQAVMSATPFPVCQGAVNTLAPLIGLTIGAGWNKRVRERLGGAASCSHIVELMGPLATTALQGLAPQRVVSINEPANEDQRLAKVDSCYAYAGEREVVARLWPHLHRPVPVDE